MPLCEKQKEVPSRARTQKRPLGTRFEATLRSQKCYQSCRRSASIALNERRIHVSDFRTIMFVLDPPCLHLPRAVHWYPKWPKGTSGMDHPRKVLVHMTCLMSFLVQPYPLGPGHTHVKSAKQKPDLHFCCFDSLLGHC